MTTLTPDILSMVLRAGMAASHAPGEGDHRSRSAAAPPPPHHEDCCHVTLDTTTRSSISFTSFSPDRINKEAYDKFVKDMRSVPPNKPLKLHLQSSGGSYFYSLKIANRIASRSGTTTAVIEDYAMSGATLIALVCDDIEMAPNACMGPIDVQTMVPIRNVVPVVERWKDRSLLADCMHETLAKMEHSTLHIYRKMLRAKHSTEGVEEILHVFYYAYDHETPLFYDDVKRCTCLRVRTSTTGDGVADGSGDELT